MYKQVGFSLAESQINKLKRAKQGGVELTLELSPEQIGGQHDLYLTNRQINKLQKGSARIKFSKTQMRAQKGGFLGALLGLATKFLPKILPVLGTLGLSAASGAISGATHKATGGGHPLNPRSGGGLRRAGGSVPLYFGNGDIKKVFGIVKTLEGKGMLQTGSCEKCMNSIQEQKGGFLGTLLASLAGSLLPTLLGGKGLRRAGQKKL